MQTGTGYNTGNAAETGDEPGSVGNLLALDPSDQRWPDIANWEDGQEYVFTKVRTRQISAGKFEVIEATTGAEEGENPGAAESGVAESAEAASGGVGNEMPPSRYPNPAIARMGM